MKKICPECSTSFDARAKSAIYCKRLCRHRAYARKYFGKPGTKPVVARCVECGKEFLAKRKSAMLCGNKCRFRLRNRLWYQRHKEQESKRSVEYLTAWAKQHPEEAKIRRRGAKNAFKFGERNRDSILERFDFKCSECQSDDHTNLVIHHIDGKGYGMKARDKNNSPENLTVLCQRCHSRLHRLQEKGWQK